MKANRIFLVGLMGSGKSHWGKRIARLLQWKFIDLDKHIEKQEKMSITEIFEKYGEGHFRTLENKYLKDLLSVNNIVVATGGGTACFHDNMRLMNKNGETYYLKVKTETSAKRLKNMTEGRPLLKGKNKNELILFLSKQLKEREPFYLQASIIFFEEKLDAITDKNILNKLLTSHPSIPVPVKTDKPHHLSR